MNRSSFGVAPFTAINFWDQSRYSWWKLQAHFKWPCEQANRAIQHSHLFILRNGGHTLVTLFLCLHNLQVLSSCCLPISVAYFVRTSKSGIIQSYWSVSSVFARLWPSSSGRQWKNRFLGTLIPISLRNWSTSHIHDSNGRFIFI